MDGTRVGLVGISVVNGDCVGISVNPSLAQLGNVVAVALGKNFTL